MAFVMPAGDYERALRLSKGSSFMEALEAGVDRNIRREANRQQMRQREELYNLQLEDEEAKRIEAEEQIVGEGLRLRDAVSGVDSEPTEEILGNLYAQGAASPSVASGGGTPIAAAGGSSRGTTQGAARGATQRVAPKAVARDIPVTYGPDSPEQGAASPPAAAPSDWKGRVVPAEADRFSDRERALAEYLSVKARYDKAKGAVSARAAKSFPERVKDRELLASLQPGMDEAEARYRASGGASGTQSWQGRPNVPYEAGSNPEAAAIGIELEEFDKDPANRGSKNYVERRKVDALRNEIVGRLEEAISLGPPLASAWSREESPSPLLGGVVSIEDEVGPPLALTPYEQWEASKEAAGGEARAEVKAVKELELGAGNREDIEAAKRRRDDSVRAYNEQYRWTPNPHEVAGGAVSPTGSLISAAVPSMLDRALMPDAAAAAIEGAISATKPIPEAADLAPGTTYPEPTEAPMSQLEQATVSLGQEAELAATAGEERALKEVEEVVVGEQVHTVKKGDYIYGISEDYGVKPQAVIKRNAPLFVDKKTGKPRKTTTPGGKVLEGPSLIYPDEKVIIPTGQGTETGGSAGPIDDREGVSKGVLATVQDKAKSASEVESELNKLQEADPDKLVNPFQKFGRSILYTPARSSVAVAIKRAQRGNFSLINQMAGRPVRNRELVGLFADYDEFVRGAKTNAKEITLNRALAEKQKATLEDRRGHAALSNLFQDQIIRNGLSQEEAVVLGDYAAELHKVDKNLVGQMLKGYQALGAAERKTALMRLKNSRYGTLARGSKGSVFNMKPSQIATNLRSWTNTRNSAEKAFTASVSSMREDPRFKPVMDIEDGFPVFTGKKDSPMAGLFRVELSNAIRLQEALEDAERHVQQWKYLQSQVVPGLPETAEAAEAVGEEVDTSVSPGPDWVSANLPASKGGGNVWYNKKTKNTLPRA